MSFQNESGKNWADLIDTFILNYQYEYKKVKEEREKSLSFTHSIMRNTIIPRNMYSNFYFLLFRHFKQDFGENVR